MNGVRFFGDGIRTQLDRHAERPGAHPVHRHHSRRAEADGQGPILNWRRNLFAVTAATFIGFTGFTLVMPFLPLYFHQLGVEDVGEIAMWSGLSLGVTPALTALLAPFWGRLADRFGRKIMVERSLVSFVVVMAAHGVRDARRGTCSRCARSRGSSPATAR